MQRTAIPYHDDSSRIFEQLRDFAYPVFLDSGLASEHRGRYDIISAQPDYLIVADANGARIKDLSTPQQPIVDDDPCAFSLLERWLNKTGFKPGFDQDLPFAGGVLGYLSYDLGRSLEELPSNAIDDIQLPWMQMGFYSWAIIIDHHKQQSWLVHKSDLDNTFLLKIQNIKKYSSCSGFSLNQPFQSNIKLQDYLTKFDKIIDYIHSGDCYQVNLAQRFSAEFTGDTWAAYKALRAIAPMPFSAYIDLGETAILSLSPERFIQSENTTVETRPIKGTRPRGASVDEDQTLAQELTDSIKDRAENLMIVDLLRNDIGKTCITGSVKVEKLFRIESYANVHHLVSVIKGKLEKPIDAVELLKGCFPGGSITGAPKVRAMEIIEELEPHQRSAYCGAIGYISNNGHMDTNISIRTLVAADNRLHCWAGGGIVADSDGQKEYQETFDKVSNLTNCLEQQFLNPAKNLKA